MSFTGSIYLMNLFDDVTKIAIFFCFSLKQAQEIAILRDIVKKVHWSKVVMYKGKERKKPK